MNANASCYRLARRGVVAAACVVLATTTAAAQRPTLSANVRKYVSIDTPTVVLTHVRVIYGTGAPPR